MGPRRTALALILPLATGMWLAGCSEEEADRFLDVLDSGSLHSVDVELYNDHSQNIHILAPGEEFSEANEIPPGGGRVVAVTFENYGDQIEFRAGRGGVVLAVTHCRPEAGLGGNPKVDWDGLLLRCLEWTPE